MNLPGFDRIVAIDTEYTPVVGGHVVPICLVAHELVSGERIRLWFDELGPEPPFPTDDRTLYVAYMAAAEIGFFLACGWPAPRRVLDLPSAPSWCCQNTPQHLHFVITTRANPVAASNYQRASSTGRVRPHRAYSPATTSVDRLCRLHHERRRGPRARSGAPRHRPPPRRAFATVWSAGSDRAAAIATVRHIAQLLADLERIAHHGPRRRWPPGRLCRLGCGVTGRRLGSINFRRRFVRRNGIGHILHRRRRVRWHLLDSGLDSRRRQTLGLGGRVSRRHRRRDIRLPGFGGRWRIS